MPWCRQRGHDTLPYGHLAKLPIALEESTVDIIPRED
jgi:hypothetical protein